MSGFGPGASFIFFAYLGVTVLVLALIGKVVHDSRRQQTRLAELEALGVRRRSAKKPDTR